MYRVTLTFKDAGMFRPPLKPTGAEHVILTPAGVSNRKTDGSFVTGVPVDTILSDCIANMFRVLLGVRPVPTFRGATEAHRAASECRKAESLAARCRIHVGSGIVIDDRDNSMKPVWEPQVTGKPVPNSWGSDSVPWAGPEELTFRVSWKSVSSEFGAERTQEFKDLVVEVLGQEALDLDMVSVFSGLYTSKSKKVAQFCNQEWVPVPYRDTLVHGKATGKFFGHSGTHGGTKHWEYVMETKGLGTVHRRSGSITVDVDDAELDWLNDGPGAATLLDSGIVSITGVEEISAGAADPHGVPAYRRAA